jgi:hypothetical protein
MCLNSAQEDLLQLSSHMLYLPARISKLQMSANGQQNGCNTTNVLGMLDDGSN